MGEREIDVVMGAKDEVSRVFDRVESSSGRTKPSAAAIDTVAASFAKTTMPGQRGENGLVKLKAESPYEYKPAEMSEVEKIYFQYAENERKLEAMRVYNEQYLALLSEVTDKAIGYEEKRAEFSMLYASKERDFKIQTASQSFQVAASFMDNLYALTGSKNAALFKVMKGFSMAQALMDTYAGFNRALASLPFPANLAAAATVLAAGMAKVQQIRATEPGGAGSAGTKNASYIGGGMPAVAEPVSLKGEPMQTQNITVHVNALDPSSVKWDKLVEDNIVPAIEGLSGRRNVALNIRVAEA